MEDGMHLRESTTQVKPVSCITHTLGYGERTNEPLSQLLGSSQMQVACTEQYLTPCSKDNIPMPLIIGVLLVLLSTLHLVLGFSDQLLHMLCKVSSFLRPFLVTQNRI